MNRNDDPARVAEVSLREWHRRLQQLAAARGCAWIVSQDQEAHRDGWEMGNSPEEELEEQLACVDRE